MDDTATALSVRAPTPARPLLGLTILVVEDSRYACDALRLLCLRSGARLRRADCLRSARRHLQVYRPSAAIVDLGLPDGSGCDLIADLAAAQPRVGVILAISGEPGAAAAALDAGADGFLEKPVESLAVFQDAILRHMPSDRHPSGPRAAPDATVSPDPVALRDDIAHAAETLARAENAEDHAYVARFLTGVAHSAGDTALAEAALRLARSCETCCGISAEAQGVGLLLQDRMRSRLAI